MEMIYSFLFRTHRFVECFATVADFILMFRQSLAHLDLLLFHRDPACPDSLIVTDGTSLYNELVQHLTKLEQLNLRVETVCAFAEHVDSIIRSFQTGEGLYLFSTSMNLLSSRLLVIHVDRMLLWWNQPCLCHRFIALCISWSFYHHHWCPTHTIQSDWLSIRASRIDAFLQDSSANTTNERGRNAVSDLHHITQTRKLSTWDISFLDIDQFNIDHDLNRAYHQPSTLQCLSSWGQWSEVVDLRSVASDSIRKQLSKYE